MSDDNVIALRGSAPGGREPTQREAIRGMHERIELELHRTLDAFVDGATDAPRRDDRSASARLQKAHMRFHEAVQGALDQLGAAIEREGRRVRR